MQTTCITVVPPLDLHTKTAAEMFNVPYDKVTKEQRATAKAYNMRVLYSSEVKHGVR